MVQWIIENFGIIGHIADHKGNLPIHFAAAGGRLVSYSLTHSHSTGPTTHPLSHSLTQLTDTHPPNTSIHQSCL